MGIRSSVKKYFSRYFLEEQSTGAQKIAAVKTLTSDLVTKILELSDFSNMEDEDIYEQLYIYESEIGGAIDRTSTMVGESFRGFTIRNAGDILEDTERKMIDEANNLSQDLQLRNYFEMFAEILEMKGNLYLYKRADLTLQILPNKHVTLIDRLDRIQMSAYNIHDYIIDPQYLVLFEGEPGQKIFDSGEYIHIKYKDTPIFENDLRGRTTFGVYSACPLHRVILPVWWKRQTMIVDILWRQKNVPREHHKISADMFNYNTYAGTPNEKRTQAMADVATFIENYARDIQSKTPDQGYITLDTTTIETLDSGSGTRYMQTNELITQINDQIWAALNMPKSMIAGESNSSYASELIIANYASEKVMQIANKIKPIILENMRDRLRLINPNYPVEKLDIKIEHNMASTDMEKLRTMAIRGQLGIYTETELRDMDGKPPLREDQRKELINTGNSGISTSTNSTAIQHPQTPQSDVQHSNDISTSTYREDKR